MYKATIVRQIGQSYARSIQAGSRLTCVDYYIDIATTDLYFKLRRNQRLLTESPILARRLIAKVVSTSINAKTCLATLHSDHNVHDRQ